MRPEEVGEVWGAFGSPAFAIAPLYFVSEEVDASCHLVCLFMLLGALSVVNSKKQ